MPDPYLLRHTRDDGSRLWARHTPGDPRRLLLGSHTAGRADVLTLDRDETQQLATALTAWLDETETP